MINPMLRLCTILVFCLALQQAQAAPAGKAIKSWFGGSSSKSKQKYVSPESSPDQSYKYQQVDPDSYYQNGENNTPRRSSVEERPHWSEAPVRENYVRESDDEIQAVSGPDFRYASCYAGEYRDYPTDSNVGMSPMTVPWDQAMYKKPMYNKNVQRVMEKNIDNKGEFKVLKNKKKKKGWFS